MTGAGITRFQGLPIHFGSRIIAVRSVINPSELIQAEIAKIRHEVRRRGGFTVRCEQIRLICPENLTAPQQFACISAIAQREGWSFALLRDGSVHFGAYGAALTALIDERSAATSS